MSKRSYYVATGSVLLVVLLLLNLPDRAASQLKLAIGTLYLPLFGMAGSVESAVERTEASFRSRASLEQQLRELTEENRSLRFKLSQFQGVWRENKRLREAIGWQERSPWTLLAAQVIGQDPVNWWLGIHIDRGRRDGLRVDLPVIVSGGLVGRVSEVGFARSRVVLVGDPTCHVAAQIVPPDEAEVQAKGVVSASAFGLDPQVVDLAYVPPGSEVHPGQEVLTSGDGGVFPKGIPIGKVLSVETNQMGLYLEARVRLAVNLNRLEEVWVLFP